ncbi:MAG TPA: TIGR03943 family protein [Actinomycetota bacterium]|nr:TIGR03943 family protein [Actinomycetota bacterium]
MTRRWSPRRLAVAGVLLVWAVVFWELLLTGRTSLYLSPRTAWVVPTGAILLTLAALGRLATARTERTERLGSVWGLGLVVLPAVLILAVPPAALGSYAASRRSLAAGVVAGPSAVAVGDRVTLASVAAATWSEEARRALADRAGSRVTFEGIVTRREGQPAGEFVLTRFIVSCCVADALSVQVRVVGVPPGRFREDQWVRVTGTFYPVGRETVVDASTIDPIPRPSDPYLSV